MSETKIILIILIETLLLLNVLGLGFWIGKFCFYRPAREEGSPFSWKSIKTPSRDNAICLKFHKNIIAIISLDDIVEGIKFEVKEEL